MILIVEGEPVLHKMSGNMDVTIRIQSRLDGKWLKTDLQQALNVDGLSQLWNEMVKDGELTGSFSDGLLNSAGITARKGKVPPASIIFSCFQVCLLSVNAKCILSIFSR